MKRVALLVVLVVLSSGPVGRGENRRPDIAQSVAVLDFVNRNPADGRDWLGKGLADMVITDLSASQRLSVVDRQRVQDLTREIDLGAAGILAPKTAPRVGRIAKVRWVLFGTFLHHDADVSLEALLIDVNVGQTVRIEQVEGPVSKLFDLEQSLVHAILAKLDVSITEEELRVVKLLKTQSLPAFEHYARSLGLFDQGQWFDALREARLARRADPGYFPVAARLAQLFYEVGEPEHAVIEYRRFAEQDRSDKLPADVCFTLGKILEQALADRAGAIAVFQRIVRRDSQYDQPFRITDPSRPSHNMDDVGGISNVRALFQEHKPRLEALERLARWQLEAGQQDDAARLYGQLWHFLDTHGLSLGAGYDFSGLNARVRETYEPLYWRLVLENRDATLYPPCSLHLLPAENATVGSDTAPTHGYCKWIPGGTFPIWLAPPSREFAEASFLLEDDGSKIPKEFKGKAQIDFVCKGYPSVLYKVLQVKPDGTWHTLKFAPGIRALETHVFHTNRWRVKFTLRPWSQPAKISEVGGCFSVNALPDGANLYINGKSWGRSMPGESFSDLPTGRYEVEARWPDGRRRLVVLHLVRGQHANVLLNADVNTLSRQVLASDGSNTYLLTDRSGRIWLLWDQVCRDDDLSHLNAESNLFCANSSDGVNWSRPRRLPVSSLDCDTTPILQQDRQGIFWLVWVSSRDPKAPKSLWIASSPNGMEWSFPRKIVLPETEKDDLARWRETHLPRPAFAIDTRNVFWLVWQGWLMRSEDASHWQVDSMLRTSDDGWADNMCDKGYHLSSTASGRPLLVANFEPKDASRRGPMLWRRGDGQRWEPLGYLNQPPNDAFEPSGSAAGRSDGTILAVTQDDARLFVREFMADGSKSKPLCVESYLTRPFHPSVAAIYRWPVPRCLRVKRRSCRHALAERSGRHQRQRRQRGQPTENT